MAALNYFLITIAVLGFLRWLAKGREDSSVLGPYGESILAHNAALKILGAIGGFILPVGLIVLAFITPPKNPDGLWVIVGIVTFFLSIGAFLFFEAHSVVKYTEEGIYKNSLWKGKQFLKWNDLESVTYSQGWGAFVLRGLTGEVIRVSIILKGIRPFADKLIGKIPEALSGANIGIRIARGELDLWGREFEK